MKVLKKGCVRKLAVKRDPFYKHPFSFTFISQLLEFVPYFVRKYIQIQI